jgi:hypothetical protein
MHRCSVDVKFNKGLIDNCQKDIQTHCNAVIVEEDDIESDENTGEHSSLMLAHNVRLFSISKTTSQSNKTRILLLIGNWAVE